MSRHPSVDKKNEKKNAISEIYKLKYLDNVNVVEIPV